jgi:hypothetical protein
MAFTVVDGKIAEIDIVGDTQRVERVAAEFWDAPDRYRRLAPEAVDSGRSAATRPIQR